MGSLTLPTVGSVYLDAVAIIYSLETQPPYWELLEPLWQAARIGDVALVTSELSWLETLVAPLRADDRQLVQAYHALYQSPEIELLAVSAATLQRAARLRADRDTLRTPDAIHAATAELRRCDAFVTNDRRLKGLPTLNVVLLDDCLRT